MKALVIYYSWTGNTKILAETIARKLNADVCAIEEVEVRKGVLGHIMGGYYAMIGRGTSIKPLKYDPARYDLLLIGSPTWAWHFTPPVNMFLEKTDLKGKKVIAFVTSGGPLGVMAVAGLKNKIVNKGGRVLTTFALRIGFKKIEKIKQESEKISKALLPYVKEKTK